MQPEYDLYRDTSQQNIAPHKQHGACKSGEKQITAIIAGASPISPLSWSTADWPRVC